MPWALDDKTPIYQQLVEILQLRILTGYYLAGQRLPSVRDLAQEASVNPNTMQRALADLEASGLITTQRTSGRLITEDQGRIDSLRRTRADDQTQDYLSAMSGLGYDRKACIHLIESIKEETT